MAAILASPQSVESGPRLLTIEEFERLPDDLFREGERVELIEGLIYTKMGQNDAHIIALLAVAASLRQAFGDEFTYGIQMPLKLGDTNRPEPDACVLQGSWRDYDGRRPDPKTDVRLVVEVSDTTLAEDRGRKARLYAKYEIDEYWIVNLRDRTLEVRQGPRPEAEEYFQTLVYREGESATINGANVAVSDLLPKAEG